MRVIAEHLSQRDVGIALLAKELSREGEIRTGFKMFLLRNGVPPEKLNNALELLEPHWTDVATQFMSHMGEQYRTAIADNLAFYESVRPEAMKGGFVDSLSRNLDMPERVRFYSELRWFTRRSSMPLILGDSVCLFETAGPRRFRPISLDDGEVRRIYLPVSADVVLVGAVSPLELKVDFRLLNKAAARCSYEFLISSCVLPAESHLIKGLGLWAGVLNGGEFEDLLTSIRREIS